MSKTDKLEPEVIRLSKNSGGSGRGMTFWHQAALCGRKAVLSDAYADDIAAGRVQEPTTPKHFLLGGVFHKMMELWVAPPPGGFVLDQDEITSDPNIREAVRLFEGYREFWDKDYWGRLVEAEVKIPSKEELVDQIEAEFGVPVYGKPDEVRYLDDATVERVLDTRGLILPGAGFYLIDHKTADSPKADTYYSDGYQAILYPYLYELEHPEQKIRGTIYNVVYKFSKRKDKTITIENFHAVFAPYVPEKIHEIKGVLKMAKFNFQHNIPNRQACRDFWSQEECFFARIGRCDKKLQPAGSPLVQIKRNPQAPVVSPVLGREGASPVDKDDKA